MNIQLIHGDCLDKLKDLPDNSVSSVVCDPPYGLSFMNKKWDYDVPSTEIWTECLRVLKPGGHLLAFGGSRTYHRMAVRIEDAGFDIRDQIMWLYASGFPKSHNIGKAIDKLQGIEIEKTTETLFNNPDGKRDLSKRSDYGYKYEAQNEWEGWGTALKPAHEPIVVARKPLSEKSVAENVLKWGTGGINIDASRVGTNGGTKRSHQGEYPKNEDGTEDRTNWGRTGHDKIELNEGRWPANIILDEEAGAVLDEQSGISSSKPYSVKAGFGTSQVYGKAKDIIGTSNHNDKGGASRFFYCAKASKKDRDEGLDGFEEKERKLWDGNEEQNSIGKLYPDGTERPEYKLKNNHPTVKPTSLMEYLIKLVTPVNGTVLDPFMGSGSTGKAAVRNGFDFIGIEREEEYINIAKARIENENRIYNTHLGPTE
jgi:site-specific DNA-methyltransferase (adenine-specific)